MEIGTVEEKGGHRLVGRTPRPAALCAAAARLLSALGGPWMSHNPSPSLFDSPFTSPAAERPSSRLPSHPHRDSLQLDEILSSVSVPPASDPAPGTGPASLSLQFFGPSSQPIDLSAFNRIQFDSNSFDDYRTPQLGQEEHYEANTPSYCGSWTSDFSSSASPTRYSNPTPPRYHLHESPSFEHLYQEAANKTRQLSLEQNTEMPPFDSTAFDEPSVDQAHHGGSEDLEASMNDGKDRDMTLMMPRTDGAQVPGGIATNGSAGTGGAAQRPFAYTRSSSGFNSFLNYANSPTTERGRPATPAYSATRSTVYDPISDSTATSGAPAVSVGSFSPPVATSTSSANGTPALSKLQIPTGPSVSLTGPTPETAKPRPKGRGTLELERVLGLWAAKTPVSVSRSMAFSSETAADAICRRPRLFPVCRLCPRSVLRLRRPQINRCLPRVSSLPNQSLSFRVTRPLLRIRHQRPKPVLRVRLHPIRVATLPFPTFRARGIDPRETVLHHQTSLLADDGRNQIPM